MGDIKSIVNLPIEILEHMDPKEIYIALCAYGDRVTNESSKNALEQICRDLHDWIW